MAHFELRTTKLPLVLPAQLCFAFLVAIIAETATFSPGTPQDPRSLPSCSGCRLSTLLSFSFLLGLQTERHSTTIHTSAHLLLIARICLSLESATTSRLCIHPPRTQTVVP